MLEPVLTVGAGLAVGGLIGLTGIGGGSLLTPVLIFGFGQSPAVAVGTDLAFAATTRLVASAPHAPGRRVDWQVARRLALGSVPGALAVFGWLWLMPRSSLLADRVIVHALALMLLLTAGGLLLQTPLQRLGLRITAAALARTERRKPALTLALGGLIGVAVTLTSVGAGALASVALLYLYPLRLSGDRLVATDIAYALPLTIVAALGHAALGHVNLVMLCLLLVGSVPGALYAQRLRWRVPAAVFRPGIAALLATAAVWMLA